MIFSFIRNISVLLLLILFNINLTGQVEEDRVKASMIYYISDFIIWPDIDSFPSFNIGIIGERPTLKNELELIATSNTIKGKPINIIQLPDNILDEEIHLAFIDKSFYNNIEDYLAICKEKHILLVTDELENELYTVVNFIEKSESQSITFEVNKQNLVLSRLDYTDDLLLYGGNMLDVKDLYHATQNLLEKESIKVKELESNIELKNTEIQAKNKTIDSLSLNIEASRKILMRLSDTIGIQSHKIESQNNLIEQQNARVSSIHSEIDRLSAEQVSQEMSIVEKEQKLDSLEQKIIYKENTIQEQTLTLTLKETELKTKNRILLLLLIIGITLLLSGILIYRAYHVKFRLNKELRLALKHLKETQSQLLHADKMASLGILTAGIAHEINNPLNFILGGYKGIEKYMQSNLQEHLPNIEVLLNSINTGVTRASKIVKGLNQFSRDNELKDELCEMHAILDNCLLMLENQLKYRIAIHKDFKAKPEIVKGNGGQLHQVILSIISNSEQAIKGKGKIDIHTRTLNNRDIEIKISDNGSGISEENLKKITTPFFTTKDPDKGTGLGLSITYNIVKEHNGQIEFKSKLNKGTTVIIKLPLYHEM